MTSPTITNTGKDKDLPEMVVTKDGIPFKDQAEGIRQFKEACLRKSKPPIGIIPRHIHEKERALALVDAITRYFEAGLMPMGDWLAEVREYVERH